MSTRKLPVGEWACTHRERRSTTGLCTQPGMPGVIYNRIGGRRGSWHICFVLHAHLRDNHTGLTCVKKTNNWLWGSRRVSCVSGPTATGLPIFNTLVSVVIGEDLNSQTHPCNIWLENDWNMSWNSSLHVQCVSPCKTRIKKHTLTSSRMSSSKALQAAHIW